MFWKVNRIITLFSVIALSNTQQLDGGLSFQYPTFERPNELTNERFSWFDTELLKALTLHEKNGNILISPLSIKTTLAMILEGADGTSAEELRRALRLSSNSASVRDNFYNLLTKFQNVNGNNGVRLEIANNVFVNSHLTPLDEYSKVVQDYYYSNVTKINFANQRQAAETVNSWVSANTHGLIPSIVSPELLGPDTSIILANAMYFKGIWEKAFKKQSTQPKRFCSSNNDCYMTPTMDIIEKFKYKYIEKLRAHIVELPYTGNTCSMVLILPNERFGLQSLLRDSHHIDLNILNEVNKTEVLITLPRFKIDFNIDLVGYLPSVYINTISNSQANLKRIVADLSVHVSNLLHKTGIEVNEQGTVAAAATGAMVVPLMSSTKPRFIANHPFLFFIRHIQTGTILFEGRVSEPERLTEGEPQPLSIQQPEQSEQVYTSQPQYSNQQIGQAGQRIQSFQPQGNQQQFGQTDTQSTRNPSQRRPNNQNPQITVGDRTLNTNEQNSRPISQVVENPFRGFVSGQFRK